MDTRETMWNEMPVTGRSAEKYFKDLEISLESLKDKKILDIGSGLNKFGNDLKSYNLDLVSMDAFYALDTDMRKEVSWSHASKELLPNLQGEKKDSQLVAGIAESLPFGDETFDVVPALFSMPMWANSFDQVRDFILEVARVLKPKGEARIYPFEFKHELKLDVDTQQKVESLFNELKEMGLVVGVKIVYREEDTDKIQPSRRLFLSRP